MHKARKQFGQHFLTDNNILERITRAIKPQAEQRIIEIGPGQGAMTERILEHINHLEVIEIDRDLVVLLQQRYPQQLTIYQSDILKFDFAQLQAEPQSLRVIGNLPYNISTPILFLLLQNIRLVKDMHLMLQKEVIDRMVAVPGNKSWGRLGVMLQPWFEIERLFNIPPAAFSPPPKVDSSFVRMIPRQTPLARIDNNEHYEQLVRAAFSQRRKTLRNAIKNYLSESEIAELDIDPGLRPEMLGIKEFANLSNRFSQKQK